MSAEDWVVLIAFLGLGCAVLFGLGLVEALCLGVKDLFDHWQEWRLRRRWQRNDDARRQRRRAF